MSILTTRTRNYWHLTCIGHCLDVFSHFLGLNVISDTKSSTIVSVIKDIIIRMQRDFDKFTILQWN